MLDRLLPAEGLRTIVGIKGKKVEHYFHAPGEDLQPTIDRLDKTHDVYFACATYAAERRTVENVQSVKSCWLDVDAGPGKPYATYKDALQALITFVKATGLPSPSEVVLSGSGLHVYWIFTSSLTVERAKPLAQRLKQCTRAYGLHIDPTRTADMASILRVPGTTNKKNGGAAPVKVLMSGPAVSVEDFEMLLPKLGPQGVAGLPKANNEFSAGLDTESPRDEAMIARKCKQMEGVKAKGGAVPEPLWRAALSVVWRCEGRDELVETYSKGDARYDPAEARSKAERTGGPATCTHFADTNPMGCLGCAFSGKLTSPILLGTVAPAPEEREGDAPDEVRLNEVGGFRVTGKGVTYGEKNAEGAVESWEPVTLCPMWVLEVREKARLDNEPDKSSLYLQWHSLDGANKRAVIPQASVYDMKLLVRWLAQHNLMPQIFEVKLLMKYIKQYSCELLKRREVKRFYEHLGWYPEGFLLGAQMITPKGPVPALVQSTSSIAGLSIQGDLEVWKDAARLLARPDYWMHAVPLFLALGTPILALCGKTSSVLSLAGPSGYGKTVSCSFAESVYGDPGKLSASATATLNAIGAQLSILRAVPMLLDETTTQPPAKIGEIIYMVPNGLPKNRLTQDGDHRKAVPWNTLLMMTSNTPIMDCDEEYNEAQQRRLIELVLARPFDEADGRTLATVAAKHFGLAGAVYLQHLAGMRERIVDLFDSTYALVKKLSRLPENNRFVLFSMTAALMGVSITNKLGLTELDGEHLIRQMGIALNEHGTEKLVDAIRIREVLSEFTVEMRSRTCIWSGRAKVGPVEVPRDPIARYDADSDTLMILSRAFREHLRSRHVSMSNLKSWLAEHGVVEKTVRLAPDTVSVWSFIFPLNRLGLQFGSQPDLPSEG